MSAGSKGGIGEGLVPPKVQVTAEDVADLFRSWEKAAAHAAGLADQRHDQIMEELRHIRFEQAAQKKRDENTAAVLLQIVRGAAGTDKAVRDILSGMGQEDDDKGRNKLTETIEKLISTVDDLGDSVPESTRDMIVAWLTEQMGKAPEQPAMAPAGG